MTRNVFPRTRPAVSIIAAATASVLIVGSVGAQDTRVGLETDLDAPSVTQVAVDASAEVAPRVTAYDAMIADLTAAAAPSEVVFRNPATEPEMR